MIGNDLTRRRKGVLQKLDTVVPINAAARSISALASGLVRRLIRADSWVADMDRHCCVLSALCVRLTYAACGLFAA